MLRNTGENFWEGEPIKFGIVGTRGIPARYGGFETFAQEISLLLTERGLKVSVYCERTDISLCSESYKGISLYYLPVTKTKHPLLYYYIGLLHSLRRENIILVTGTGGSIFYFLNLFFKKKIITITDGIESRRAKWSLLKRTYIKFSEYLAVKHSSCIISDSKAITSYLVQKYPKLESNRIETIEYGAVINNLTDEGILEKYSLKKDDYYLVVARLEPENNIKMIIDGFNRSKSSKKLIIIGNIESNKYVNQLLDRISAKIRFTGGVYNKHELAVIRFSSFAYIHGHSVGGTNPSLLEAMGSSNIAICHDNAFNREVTGNTQLYFSEAEELACIISKLEQKDQHELQQYKRFSKERIEEYYNWDNISEKYLALFKKLKSDRRLVSNYYPKRFLETKLHED